MVKMLSRSALNDAIWRDANLQTFLEVAKLGDYVQFADAFEVDDLFITQMLPMTTTDGHTISQQGVMRYYNLSSVRSLFNPETPTPRFVSLERRVNALLLASPYAMCVLVSKRHTAIMLADSLPTALYVSKDNPIPLVVGAFCANFITRHQAP